MDGTNAIPAAWHDDPAGSGGQRWWDGNAWTEHVRARDALSPVQSHGLAFSQPTVSAPAYQPMGEEYRSFAQEAPDSDWRYSQAVVSNISGAVAFWLGVGSFAAFLVSTQVPLLVWFAVLPGPLVLVFGIRALVLRARGRATALAMPIIGMVLSVVSTALVVLAVVAALMLIGSPPTQDSLLEINRQKFPDNPEMALMYTTGYEIQHRLHQQFPDEDWPTTLVADASGTVSVNGVTLGTIMVGQTFEYSTVDDGRTFVFTLQGTVAGEQVVYDSSTELLAAQCFETDLTCGF